MPRYERPATPVWSATFLIIITAFSFGCDLTEPSAKHNASQLAGLTETERIAPPPLPTPDLRLIDNDASELALAIGDFPLGWQTGSSGPTLNGVYESQFLRIGSIPAYPEVLISEIRVLPSVSEAESVFSDTRRNIAERFSIASAGLGDRSFLYAGNAQYELYFVKRNVIARITMFTTYGGSLEDVKSWGAATEDKVDRVKTLALPGATLATSRIADSKN